MVTQNGPKAGQAWHQPKLARIQAQVAQVENWARRLNSKKGDFFKDKSVFLPHLSINFSDTNNNPSGVALYVDTVDVQNNDIAEVSTETYATFPKMIISTLFSESI